MPPQPQDPKADKNTPKPVDPASFLLPKEEHAPDTAQRVNAGQLLAQEQKAAATGAPAPTIGEKSVPAVPAAPKKEEPVVRAIQTFGADINEVVREGGVSMAQMAAAEAIKRAATHGEPVAPQPLAEQSSSVRPVLMIASAIFLLCGLGIMAALFLKPSGVAPAPQTPTAPFIEVDQTKELPLTPTADHDLLMTQLQAARTQVQLSLGLVARLYPDVPTTTASVAPQLPAQEFMTLLAPDAPQDLVRTVGPQYLVGVHSYDENQAFVVLQVDSYQQAYSGMLAWEEQMPRDLEPFFTRHPAAHIQNSDATTTTATDTPPEFLNTGFVDQVVDNHDARVVRNAQGDILLLWTFLDRNTLVITTNEYTLNEVIRRINTASLVPQPK